MISIAKGKKKINDDIWLKIRLIFFGIVITFCFLFVVGHIMIIQFVEGKELSEKAYNQQVKNQILSPSRGTIYDANGEILAQSIAVDTVSLNPGKVTYANNDIVPDEEISEGMSNIFNITYIYM